MQTEPPGADPPKRTRRWFQFSLRTLMIGVTLLAVASGYVACEARIVAFGKEFVQENGFHEGFWSPLVEGDPNKSPSLLRQLLGDSARSFVEVPIGLNSARIKGVASLFPESAIVVGWASTLTGRWNKDRVRPAIVP